MNKKIKIAFLSDYPFSISFGGKEIQMLQYHKLINDNYYEEFEIKLVDYWNLNEFQDINIVHFFGYSNWYNDLTTALRSKYPKLKILISPTYYLNNLKLHKFASSCFNYFPIPNYYSYKRRLFDNVTKIICNSNSEINQIKRLFPKIESKFELIYNSIEESFIEFSDNKNSDLFCNEYQIDKNYLLSVSFFDQRKNTIKLIKSFLKFAKNFNTSLVLIGQNRYSNPKEFDEVFKLMNSNKNLIRHIPYLERNSDMLKSAYLNCKAHIMPSYLETPGISNLEAGYFSKPIIVGDCKPVREYFKNYALYVNPHSIDNISNKISEVFNYKEIEIVEIGDDLNKLITNSYQLNNSIKKLLEIYRNS